MLTRRDLVWFGMVAAPAHAVLHARPRPEIHRLPVLLDDMAGMGHLPLIIAHRLGFFESEGVRLELEDRPGRAWSPKVAGSFNVISGAFSQLYLLYGSGMPYRAFVQMCRAPQVVLGVDPRLSTTVRSPRDLRGLRMAVVGLESVSHHVAQLALRRAGLSPDEVTFVNAGDSREVLDLFRSGQVDALSHVGPVVTDLERRGEIKVLLDTRQLKETEQLYGGPVPATCLSASAEFINKHPGTCQILAQGVQQGLKWLQTAGPSDMVKILPEALIQGDRSVYLAAFNKMRHTLAVDGVIPPSGPFTVFRSMVHLGAEGLPARIDIATTYTNEFVRRPPVRFKP